MSRLVIVSNRVTVPEPGKPPPPGGLAVAVHAALKNRSGHVVRLERQGRRQPERRADGRPSATTSPMSSPTCRRADYQEYYNGFANRVLWPILHYRVDLAEFSRSDLTGYLRVNGLFADKLSPSCCSPTT